MAVSLSIKVSQLQKNINRFLHISSFTEEWVLYGCCRLTKYWIGVGIEFHLESFLLFQLELAPHSPSLLCASLRTMASSSADTSRLLHVLHTTLARIGANVWFEYVPSKSNIADAPSRGDRTLLLALGASFVAPTFPTREQLGNPAACLPQRRESRGARAARKRNRV